MELFTIQCTTCKARLVVKDESVIGDILSCPKCSSMVQVVPPVGWKLPGAGNSSPGELPAVAAAAPRQTAPVEKKPVSKPRSEGSQKKKAAAAAAAIPPALPPRPEPQAAADTEPSQSAGAESVPSEAAATMGPAAPETSSTWLSTAVAWAKRDWIMLSSGLAGGVALGAVVWLVVATGSTEPLEVAETPVAASDEPADNEPSASPARKEPQPENPKTAQPTAPTDAAPKKTEVVAQATPPADPDAINSAAADTSQPSEPPPAKPAPADTSEDVAPQEPAKSPALRLDPIRPTPSGIPLDVAAIIPSASETKPAVRAEPEPEPTDDVAESPGKPAPLSSQQINERLSVSLPSVEFTDVPLSLFAAFIADVSSVPVTFDDAALAGNGAVRDVRIDVKLTQTTAGDALRAAAKRAGLAIAIRDGQIVVTRGDE